MTKLASALALASAAFILAACAAPAPRRSTVTTHYHRTNAPLVLRTPRGNVTFHLLASEAGFALDRVRGDRSRPFTIGASSPWTSLDLTPDGRGLLLYASVFSATGPGSGGVNVSIANEKLSPDALAGLREGDVLRLVESEVGERTGSRPTEDSLTRASSRSAGRPLPRAFPRA